MSLAGGWIEVASIVHRSGEVVVSMRPVRLTGRIAALLARPGP